MVEGSLHAVMLGASETYLGAFAVELGHDAAGLALLATLPLCLGASAQLLAGHLIGAWGRKRVSVVGALLQATSHLGFIWLALATDTRLWTFLAIKCLFWVSGSLVAPAWSDWIASLTAQVSRQKYFARRSSIVHASLLVAFALSGFSLFRGAGHELDVFAVLFLVGLLARLSSSALLMVQADPDPPERPSVGPWARLRLCLREGRFRIVVYQASLMCGASVAIPFFTPYMLNELRLDYASFATLSCVSILSKALVYPWFRRLGAWLGLSKMLVLSGIGIALIPLLWTASRSFEFLILVHVMSGAAWAGLEFSSFQILMNEIRAELRSEFFSIANALSGWLQVVGALGGGLLLRAGWLEYTGLFLASAISRAAPLLLLVAWLPSLELPKRLRGIPTRLFTVRPSAGAAQRPILPTAEREDDTRANDG